MGRRRPLVPRRAAPGGRPLHPRLRDGPRGATSAPGRCGCGPRWAVTHAPLPEPRAPARPRHGPRARPGGGAHRRGGAGRGPRPPHRLHRRAHPSAGGSPTPTTATASPRPGSARTWRSARRAAPSTSRGGTSSTPRPRTGAAPTAPPVGSGPGCRAPRTPPSSPAAWSSGGTTRPAASPASSTTGRSASRPGHPHRVGGRRLRRERRHHLHPAGALTTVDVMAGSGHGNKAVVAAMLANGAIAIAKFVGFALTRSSAMLAEGVHSVADTGNQALLLLGGQAGQEDGERGAPLRLRPRAVLLVVRRRARAVRARLGVRHLRGHPQAPAPRADRGPEDRDRHPRLRHRRRGASRSGPRSGRRGR